MELENKTRSGYSSFIDGLRTLLENYFHRMRQTTKVIVHLALYPILEHFFPQSSCHFFVPLSNVSINKSTINFRFRSETFSYHLCLKLQRFFHSPLKTQSLYQHLITLFPWN
ncbi:hypothetical protein V8G54_023152 [Vigna mungo]|uniref:Uncharacterized protein n=1 Tax=Vigna mungo TaxID=3915 RepID=A0AAQ3N4R0_VIGMU